MSAIRKRLGTVQTEVSVTIVLPGYVRDIQAQLHYQAEPEPPPGFVLLAGRVKPEQILLDVDFFEPDAWYRAMVEVMAERAPA